MSNTNWTWQAVICVWMRQGNVYVARIIFQKVTNLKGRWGGHEENLEEEREGCNLYIHVGNNKLKE